jgi:hypothetical protein
MRMLRTGVLKDLAANDHSHAQRKDLELPVLTHYRSCCCIHIRIYMSHHTCTHYHTHAPSPKAIATAHRNDTAASRSRLPPPFLPLLPLRVLFALNEAAVLALQSLSIAFLLRAAAGGAGGSMLASPTLIA